MKFNYTTPTTLPLSTGYSQKIDGTISAKYVTLNNLNFPPKLKKMLHKLDNLNLKSARKV